MLGAVGMRHLPLVFHSIVASLVGCSDGATIDRSKFVDNLCDADGFHPFRALKPAFAIDGATFRTAKNVFDTVGTMCATATDKASCDGKATEPTTEGWFRPTEGNVLAEKRWVVTTAKDEVRKFVTTAELAALVGTIDNAREGALLLTETTVHRISCGEKNARSLPDGSFEILAQVGTGCGDDIELHVVRVRRDGSIEVVERETLKKGDPNCAIGRRTSGVDFVATEGDGLGDFFARMAHLEAASVPAFERLARELAAHGAPLHLVREAERSARDEVRHARAVARLARRFGGVVPPLVVEALPIRDLATIALENAVEGCVRETFGALVATYQGRTARDREIAKVMRGIARDETRHAQLSWEIAAWSRTRVEGVDRAIDAALVALRDDLARPSCDDAITLAGFPTPPAAVALLDALRPSLIAA